MKQHVKLVSDGTGNGTKLLIDGVEVRSARALSFTVSANNLGTLSFDLHVDEVEIDGAVNVHRAIAEKPPT